MSDPLRIDLVELRRQVGTRRSFQRGGLFRRSGCRLDLRARRRAGRACARTRIGEQRGHGRRHDLGLAGKGSAAAASAGQRSPRGRRSTSCSPTSGDPDETYPIDGDEIYLRPLVRDASCCEPAAGPAVPPGACLGPDPARFPARVEPARKPNRSAAGRRCPRLRSTTDWPARALGAGCSQTRMRRRRPGGGKLPGSCAGTAVRVQPVEKLGKHHAGPEEENVEVEDADAPGVSVASQPAVAVVVPTLRFDQTAPHRVRQLRLVSRPPGRRRQLSLRLPTRTWPCLHAVAVDAMGGDFAPSEIVAGAVSGASRVRNSCTPRGPTRRARRPRTDCRYMRRIRSDCHGRRTRLERPQIAR